VSERKKPPPFGCQKCERRWDGLTEAHCATCCAHFGSTGAFDLHRVGRIHPYDPALDTRCCGDPATLTSRTGRLLLVAALRASGTVWVQRHTRPHPNVALSQARAPGIGT
jgi:hypothetical protein